MGSVINIDTGPMIGQAFLFIPINAAAFFLTLLLILRIGKGAINLPIILIALGFLLSAFTPLVTGIRYLWIVPLIQTFFSAVGILALMKVFGVFSMLLEPHKKNV